jgi:hypothetical protein
MQLLIAFGLANGMAYTDIQNIIAKSKEIYNISSEQYEQLENQVQDKIAEEKQEQQEAEEAKTKYIDSLINIQI